MRRPWAHLKNESCLESQRDGEEGGVGLVEVENGEKQR